MEECEALLVVMGPKWLQAQDAESGLRRLDDEADGCGAKWRLASLALEEISSLEEQAARSGRRMETRAPATYNIGMIPVLLLSLLAANFWESKPWRAWSEQETARLLVDSPWAKSEVIRFEGELVERLGAQIATPPPPASPGAFGNTPRGGSGPIGSMVGGRKAPIPSGAAVGVRWESARPLREAIAATKHATAVTPAPDRYVLVIDRIPPYVERADPAGLRDALLAISQLSWDGGEPVHPTEVTITANDAGLVVRLEFPRRQDVKPNGMVELHTRIGVSRVRCVFRLKTMTVGGRLEL